MFPWGKPPNTHGVRQAGWLLCFTDQNTVQTEASARVHAQHCPSSQGEDSENVSEDGSARQSKGPRPPRWLVRKHTPPCPSPCLVHVPPHTCLGVRKPSRVSPRQEEAGYRSSRGSRLLNEVHSCPGKEASGPRARLRLAAGSQGRKRFHRRVCRGHTNGRATERPAQPGYRLEYSEWPEGPKW